MCSLSAAVILAGIGAFAGGTWRAIDLVLSGYCVLTAIAATIWLALRRPGPPEDKA